ncbi:RagB/SusD family nutrient uptake outer membrane protein [Rapidithrix thailandica]|uniref:RagB/SusD family nutrient uptake outer membrane protein n=1 Tax=Rapidithrix thailandica TaxID=413964 RepID=A0AAW9S6H8_9BACT
MTFKPHIKTCLIIAGWMFLMGCSEFLEKEPIGKVSKNLLFVDMDGARAAMAGAYNRMAYYYGREFSLYGDIAGDDVDLSQSVENANLQNIHNFQSDAENDLGTAGYVWRNIFEALTNVNNILEAIPDLTEKAPNHQEEIKFIQGQTLFLRALCHLDLSKAYAQHYTFTPDASHLGVPVLLKTPGAEDNVARQTMQKTYEQIINDLKQSAELLENFEAEDAFTVSQEAAWALLSRVYLYQEEWQLAVDYADKVIQSGRFSLTEAEEYKDMYQTSEAGDEAILRFYLREKDSRTLAAMYSSVSSTVYCSQQLYDQFAEKDVRKTMFEEPLSGKLISVKYAVKNNETNYVPIDPFVVRLSEIYLNRAEAFWQLNQPGKAAMDVKKLLEQRVPEVDHEAVLHLDKEPLYSLICMERRKELCFEGHRLYDISRRKENLERGAGCASSVCQLSYPNPRFILPIPRTELDANGNMQPNPEIN